MYTKDPSFSEATCSNQILVELRNDASKAQASKAGNYIIQNGTLFGMPYWSKIDGASDIWFEKGRWRISNQSSPGSTQQGIQSKKDALLPCPDMTEMKWIYYNTRNEWVNATGNDIKLLPRSGSKK